MKKQIKKILKDIFGYDNFRGLQEEIINNVLNKKNTLAIMPTGSGKSLCYQIPALIFEGLTIVISPLISLMKDQVESLHELDINAVFLNSSLSLDDYNKTLYDIQNNQVKLLYIAPETLLKPNVLNVLSNSRIDCITIDEAHCISEWGHDFRPEYRKISTIRRRFPQSVCIALTATATQQVREDIKASLQLESSNEFIASFDRDNLFIEIVDKTNPMQQTIDFINKFPDQSGIIYCFTRKQVDEVYTALKKKSFSVKPYHAGLSDLARKTNQELFIKDDIQIIVATVAFGMGINKPNVRFVLHYNLPKNIESYYQQIGRAGRDGLKSHCLLLFSYQDIQKIKFFIDQKNEDEQIVAYFHLKALLQFLESEYCRRLPMLHYFGENYSRENCCMCDNCTTPKTERTDLTIAAQKFLSCIVRTGERFGINYIIDVLRGSTVKRIMELRHNTVSTYGIGKEYSKKQWQAFARQFIQQGLMKIDLQYGGLKLTPPAYAVFKNELKVMGTAPREEKAQNTAPEFENTDYDKDLFMLLKKERKKIAERLNVPPYVIFSDKTMIEFAVYFPQSEENLLTMYGVGKAKQEKYGKIFIELITDYCKINKISEKHKIIRQEKESDASNEEMKPKKKRHIVIGEAYNNGMKIEELLKEYNIKLKTMLDHLTNYARDGLKINMTNLLSLSKVNEEQRKEIINAFSKHGDQFLKPIFEELHQTVSYDDLKIERINYINSFITDDN